MLRGTTGAITLAAHDLDAPVAPTNRPAWPTDHINGDSFGVGSSSLTAVAGYANLTVSAGDVFGLRPSGCRSSAAPAANGG